MAEKLAILRFSALGDIALLVPVVQKLKERYPATQVTIISQPFAEALFRPQDVDFRAVKVKEYKGAFALSRLGLQLYRELQPDILIDQHDVIRSKVIRKVFAWKKVPVFTIDKGRKQKKKLTRRKNKQLIKLKHVAERYAATFSKAGFPVHFNPQEVPEVGHASAEADSVFASHKAEVNLGIAPFAMHRGKTWPREKWTALLQELAGEGRHFWFFGGPDEKEDLHNLAREAGVSHTVMAGRLGLDAEIATIQKLDVFLAQDSSNMHLATLAGTPVVSIWGATHPWLGFRPLGAENQKNIVQISTDELDCRPCSAFGSKPCFRGDYACLHWLDTDRVRRKVEGVLSGY